MPLCLEFLHHVSFASSMTKLAVKTIFNIPFHSSCQAAPLNLTPPSAFLAPKCALWDCFRPAQGLERCQDYCSTNHELLENSEGLPGMTPILRPGGIDIKNGPLFAAVLAKTLGKEVGIPKCEGAASTKAPWNASEFFDLSFLEGETIREWLFFDKPRRAFDSGTRKQRSLPDYGGHGWHESRAGDCFYLASCYEMAAQVYARGSFFSHYLNVYAKGGLFDIGLHYIQHWKQNESADPGWAKSHDLHAIEQQFLESCAHNYFDKKDIKSMMKFVKAFHSMDLKRDFLKSLSLLGELLELEEESGNYMEAVHIAKMIGDVIHEADLLGKAGAFGGHRRTARWRALFAGAVVGKSMLLTGLEAQHTSPTGHLELNLSTFSLCNQS